MLRGVRSILLSPFSTSHMRLTDPIQQALADALRQEFHLDVAPAEITLQPTKKEFEGFYTFVTFPYAKTLRQAPAAIGEKLGQFVRERSGVVSSYNVVQGFLNLSISDEAWLEAFRVTLSADFGQLPPNGQTVMVEYSSPNTNKPLHLGHLRNNFLGYSVAEILKANGFNVLKTNVVNNRGIHICKSMLAYQRFGNGETPESTGEKGDKLVGRYYVEFDRAYKAEIETLTLGGMTKEQAEREAPLMKAAQQMLLDWEAGDPATRALWEKMNGWVYAGFAETYRSMGVDFDKMYYESDTYLLGKEIVEEGLEKGVFYRRPDGSVWIDLTAEGLDEKLVLRADGTSVYITQDLGLADLKYQDFPMQKSVYVVGNEQDYHFEVLFHILQKLNRPYADGLFHLSYGMVDLPSGKMKSREGTVVDADDLIAEMGTTAEETTKALGKIEGFSDEEATALYHTLAMGALKYYLLRVDPKKRMLFNPQESIDFHGNTGPFIQYTHARIRSVLRKSPAAAAAQTPEGSLPSSEETVPFGGLEDFHPTERELIFALSQYPQRLAEAGAQYSPALMAQYAYELAKAYNQFYAEVTILGEPDAAKRRFRLQLSATVAQTIRLALGLLGVQAPERM
jgi:arginyl-tRNA synthetase